MKILRPAAERGQTRLDWLDSRHTFSFGDYHDPAAMGFRVLRVLNDDRVAPGGGFPTHGHRDMEIVTYVLSGGLGHRDSLGTGSTIHPGDVQRMSAGAGVRHSEWNASKDAPVHFLQIWILPDRAGVPPSYEQKSFPEAERQDRLCLVASPDGRAGSVALHQDVALFASLLGPGKPPLTYALGPKRFAYVHVATGAATVNGQALSEGDGLALADESAVVLAAAGEVGEVVGEVLLFDLP